MKLSEMQAASARSYTIVSVSPLGFRKDSVAHARHIVDDKDNLIFGEDGSPRVSFLCDYVLPPAPEGGYSSLVIRPAFQRILNTASPDRLDYIDTPIAGGAKLIAEDLVASWCDYMLGGKDDQRPGIGVIEGDTPTKAELDRLHSRHEAWCRWLINDADARHDNPRERGSVTDLHRKAAEYLRLEDTVQHPWIRIVRSGDTKLCPACGEQIKSIAVVCRHCRLNLADYYESNGYPENTIRPRDPEVAKIMRQRAKTGKATAPVMDEKPEEYETVVA